MVQVFVNFLVVVTLLQLALWGFRTIVAAFVPIPAEILRVVYAVDLIIVVLLALKMFGIYPG